MTCGPSASGTRKVVGSTPRDCTYRLCGIRAAILEHMIAADERADGRAGTRLVAELAQALGEVRRARGLRQVDVALIMGTSQSCVSDFERGKANPQLDFVARYAAAIDADLRIAVTSRESRVTSGVETG